MPGERSHNWGFRVVSTTNSHKKIHRPRHGDRSGGTHPGRSTLPLAPNCVYTLTAAADTTWDAGLPGIDGKLTINGNHATIGRAQDAPQVRIIANWGDLTLNEVTVTGGHAPDGTGTDASGEGTQGESGGGIENWGPLTITNSVITGNTAGAGAPGADATTSAGRGGLGGFGGGIAAYSFRPATLTITNSSVTDNTTADGGQGGSGGADGGGDGDGGSGGTGAGLFYSPRLGEPLSPVVAETTITGNQAGRGGDAGVAGPGGYTGRPGFGGSGGGLSVFYDTLTLDGGTVSDNAAGEPGAGASPLPASGGGIHTLSGTGHVGQRGRGERQPARQLLLRGRRTRLRQRPAQRTGETAVLDRQADDLAVATSAVHP